MNAPPDTRKAPFRDILAYTSGDGVNSLILNSISAFAMLYFTDALGLDYKLAGLAMGVVTLWDAITDPVMGHISDNTRSRYGRRHPYMLVGGIAAAICYFFIWGIPERFQSPTSLFWYLVVVNLLLRTGITVFSVAYGALGFEICTDYAQRTTLQGARWGFNMFVNLAGPATAHYLFFQDQGDIKGTAIADNYVRMGTVFTIVVMCFAMFVTYATRKHIVDTRHSPEVGGNSPRDFLRDFTQIIFDKIPRTVFIFDAIVALGIVVVASLQMYVYVHFMEFSSAHRSIVHGSTMVGCGLGGLMSSLMVRRFDKKPAICIAVIVAVLANVMLIVIFVTGWLAPGTNYTLPEGTPLLGGWAIPVSMLVFMLFHATYWAGNGVIATISKSMMADASEICKHRHGKLKDGGYSAMLSFVLKASAGIGLLASGYCLAWAGFDVKNEVQTPEAIRDLTLTTFLAGSAIALIAMTVIMRYPVTEEYMRKIKTDLAEAPNSRQSAESAG
jgi:GPH family glycoside/pentoside/hexuronide:cation symporter